MELPEIDALELQAREALLDALTQVLRATIRLPLVGAGAREPALGRDDDMGILVRCKYFGDEPLAHLGAVAVGGVDEIDAELGDAFQDALRLGRVCGLTPDAGAGDAHRPEAESVDGKIAADGEGSAGAHVELVHDEPS